MNTYQHQSVLLTEAIDALAIKANGIYIDATFGRGGHSQAILKCLGQEGVLLALDRDPQAIEFISSSKLLQNDARFHWEHQPFSKLTEVCEQYGWVGQIDGILFDLGVSSPQLDQAERGFSFNSEGPLDMRMDPTRGISASDWINQASIDELAKVFKEFGEERFAYRIAKAIDFNRRQKKIETTRELAEIVSKANPAWERHKHPATRVFQAIRIYINQELEELAIALPKTIPLLRSGGRLVVISFHSLEDRIVKHFMRDHFKKQNKYPKGFAIREIELSQTLSFKRIGKPIYPSESEVKINPRARSAVMRTVEKI